MFCKRSLRSITGKIYFLISSYNRKSPLNSVHDQPHYVCIPCRTKKYSPRQSIDNKQSWILEQDKVQQSHARLKNLLLSVLEKEKKRLQPPDNESAPRILPIQQHQKKDWLYYQENLFYKKHDNVTQNYEDSSNLAMGELVHSAKELLNEYDSNKIVNTNTVSLEQGSTGQNLISGQPNDTTSFAHDFQQDYGEIHDFSVETTGNVHPISDHASTVYPANPLQIPVNLDALYRHFQVVSQTQSTPEFSSIHTDAQLLYYKKMDMKFNKVGVCEKYEDLPSWYSKMICLLESFSSQMLPSVFKTLPEDLSPSHEIFVARGEMLLYPYYKWMITVATTATYSTIHAKTLFLYTRNNYAAMSIWYAEVKKLAAHLTLPQVSSIIYALAIVRELPSESFVNEILEKKSRLFSDVPQSDNQSMENFSLLCLIPSLYGLGTYNIAPCYTYMQRVEEYLRPRFGKISPTHVFCVLEAFEKLRWRFENRDSMLALLQELNQHVIKQAYSSIQLDALIHNIKKTFDLRNDLRKESLLQEVLNNMVTSVEPYLTQLPLSSLLRMLKNFLDLGMEIPHHFMDSWMDEVKRREQEFNARNYSFAVLLVARSNYGKCQRFFNEYSKYMIKNEADCDTQCLIHSMEALSRMKLPENSEFMDLWWRQLKHVLPSLNLEVILQLFSYLRDTGYVVDRQGQLLFSFHLNRTLDHASSRSLMQVLSLFHDLDFNLPTGLFMEWSRVAMCRKFSVAETLEALRIFKTMQHYPVADVVDQMAMRCLEELGGMSTPDVLRLLEPYRMVGRPMPDNLSQAWQEEILKRMEKKKLSARELSVLCEDIAASDGEVSEEFKETMRKTLSRLASVSGPFSSSCSEVSGKDEDTGSSDSQVDRLKLGDMMCLHRSRLTFEWHLDSKMYETIQKALSKQQRRQKKLTKLRAESEVMNMVQKMYKSAKLTHSVFLNSVAVSCPIFVDLSHSGEKNLAIFLLSYRHYVTVGPNLVVENGMVRLRRKLLKEGRVSPIFASHQSYGRLPDEESKSWFLREAISVQKVMEQESAVICVDTDEM